jgi:ankyrin repeat protein
MTRRRLVRLLSLLALVLGVGAPLVVAAAGRAVPIVDAARDGDVIALRALLAQHVNVNAPEPDGSTALHWAADRGDATAVDLLLRHGADAKVVNHYGVAPLALAAASGNAAVVTRLLKAGADPNTVMHGGETALMTAARAGRTDAVQALIEGGADVNAREATRGQTALMWAAAEGHVAIIRRLVQHGAEITAASHAPSSPKNITDGESIYKRVAPRVDIFTSLQFAVQAGHLEATKALLDLGADIKNETPQGLSLLHLAIANAHYDVAALLVDRGADVNDANIGWTPLQQVVRVRTLNIGQFPHPVPTGAMTSYELAKYLLAHGATIDARTTKGWQDGWRGGFGLQATAFLLAAKGADYQMMALLAANGADVHAVNANNTNAIMAASGVEMFNPNEDSGSNADGLIALKLAIELGAGDINGKSRSGDAALHGAVHRASNEIVQLLVDSGAQVDIKNGKGLTPLRVANGEDNFIGMVGSRPEQIALLKKLMIERGVTPDMNESDERFRFGVKTVDATK